MMKYFRAFLDRYWMTFYRHISSFPGFNADKIRKSLEPAINTSFAHIRANLMASKPSVLDSCHTASDAQVLKRSADSEAW